MSLLHPGIQAFLAIVQQGTVHGAARQIGLTQTGVTQRIRALERDLRTTLFVRSRRGMLVTAEGEALVRWCQSVGELEGELLPFARRGESVAEVRVSVTGPSSLMRCRIIPEAAAAIRGFPGVTLRLLTRRHRLRSQSPEDRGRAARRSPAGRRGERAATPSDSDRRDTA